MSPDFKEILSTFNDHEVKYLIVGAYAVMKYGEPRYTKDLDIWVESSHENAAKVYAALGDFGAPLAHVSVDDFASDGFFQMGRPPVRIDILMSIEGVDFSDGWKNRQSGDFDGVVANFIGLAELIQNKRCAGRPQDVVDLESLEKNDKQPGGYY
jgi:hypothetical protein